MKMKRFGAVILSACLMLGCTLPAQAAPVEPADAVISSDFAEEKVVQIPQNLLNSMENDVNVADFFRFISFRDINRFFRKMKSIYSVFDISAKTLSTSWDLLQ